MIVSINIRRLALEKQVSGKTGLTKFGDFKGLTRFGQSLFFSASIDQEDEKRKLCPHGVKKEIF